LVANGKFATGSNAANVPVIPDGSIVTSRSSSSFDRSAV
jgi:hypothetical protein